MIYIFKFEEGEQMKKVIMLSSVASMIDLFNKDNIQTLKDLGSSVHVACNFEFGSITSPERVAEFKQELEKNHISYTHLPIPRSIFDLKNIVSSYRKLKKLLKDNNFSMIHCHSPIGGVIARLVGRKFRKHGLKVIYTAHGFHFFEGAPIKNWIIYYPIEKYLSNFTDTLVTINNEDYKRAQNFFQGKLEYVPGIGIDTKKFSKSLAKNKNIRKEIGLSPEDFVLISVGQLSKRKNHSIVLKALSKIKNDKLKYVLIGFGELQEELKKMASELNIANRVIFLGYRADINELLHAADCFIFPSLQEGLPVSLMEAMATGLPILCSEIRGNTDLTSSKNGIYFDPSDESSVVKAINLLMFSDLEKLSEGSLKAVKQYDREIIEKKMKTIYKDMLY